MLSIPILDRLRAAIGDPYVYTMDEISADGINASWVLTNHPLQRASESIFVSGFNQASYTTTTTLDANAALGDYEIVVSALGSITIGDQICIQDPDDLLLDPAKFEVIEIDTLTLTLNRRLDRYCLVDWQVDKVSKAYTIDYTNGILFFTAAQDVGTRITAGYNYSKYSDTLLDTLWTDAQDRVTIDTGETFDINNSSHVTLAILATHILLINKDISESAGGSIKIRQGSTSLDLSGQTRALQAQLKDIVLLYTDTLTRYLMGALEGSYGESIVGWEDNINA